MRKSNFQETDRTGAWQITPNICRTCYRRKNICWHRARNHQIQFCGHTTASSLEKSFIMQTAGRGQPTKTRRNRRSPRARQIQLHRRGFLLSRTHMHTHTPALKRTIYFQPKTPRASQKGVKKTRAPKLTGLRSQWMMFSRCKRRRHWINDLVNLWIKLRLKPW